MKIGMLFSGYGGQYVGMGKDLYDNSRAMQELFEEASNCLGSNFVKLCFASSDAELSSIENAYVAIFLLGASLYTLLHEAGVKVDLVAGHDIGEFAALFASGSLSLPDGLYLLNKYARAYQELLSNIKISVAHVSGIPVAEIKKLSNSCKTGESRIDIGCFMLADSAYISGPRDTVLTFMSKAQEIPGARVEEVDAAFGLHSCLMNDVVEKMKMYQEKVDFKDLSIPMINGVDGVCIKGGESAKYSTMRQINEPVLWDQVMENFVGIDIIIVIGPGTELAENARLLFPDKKIFSVNTKSDIKQVVDYAIGEGQNGLN